MQFRQIAHPGYSCGIAVLVRAFRTGRTRLSCIPGSACNRGVCNSRRPNSPLISFRWLRFVAGRRTVWGLGPLRSSRRPCRLSRLTEARHALALSPGLAIGLAPHRAAAATTCTEYCVLGLPSRQQSTWGGFSLTTRNSRYFRRRLQSAQGCLGARITASQDFVVCSNWRPAVTGPPHHRRHHGFDMKVEARMIRTNPGRPKAHPTQPDTTGSGAGRRKHAHHSRRVASADVAPVTG